MIHSPSDAMYSLLFGVDDENAPPPTPNAIGHLNNLPKDVHDPTDGAASLLSLLSGAVTQPHTPADVSAFSSGLISGSLHGGSFVGVRGLKEAKAASSSGVAPPARMLQLHNNNKSRPASTSGVGLGGLRKSGGGYASARTSQSGGAGHNTQATATANVLPEPEDFLARLERKRVAEAEAQEKAEKAKKEAAEAAAKRLKERQEAAERRLREERLAAKQEREAEDAKRAEEEAAKLAIKEQRHARVCGRPQAARLAWLEAPPLSSHAIPF